MLRRHRAPVRRAGVRRALLFLCAWAGAALGAPTVALHYGAQPPLDELKAFDIVVVEPDHGFDPLAFRKSYSALYAYVSVGGAWGNWTSPAFIGACLLLVVLTLAGVWLAKRRGTPPRTTASRPVS